MITYILWCDGIYLCTIVQEGHTTFFIYLQSGHVFDSVPSLKRVQIQEGSLQGGFYISGASIWELFMALVVVRGVQAPFIDAVPSFPFNCFLSLEIFISGQLWMKCLGLLQWQQYFSSAWASFTTLANWTMTLLSPPQFHQDHHSLGLHHYPPPLLPNVPSGGQVFFSKVAGYP